MCKKIITFLLISLMLFCCVSCDVGHQNPTNCDSQVLLELDGVTVTQKVKLKLTNLDTGEKYEFTFRGVSFYQSTVYMDYGTYQIDEVLYNKGDTELSATSSTFEIVPGVHDVKVEFEEIDKTGTLLWHLRRNALTIIALIGCVVALFVVKSRKTTL